MDREIDREMDRDDMMRGLRRIGVGGFYSGVLPSVARAFVVSGSRFSAYEFAYTMLSKHVEGNDI